MIRIVTLTVLGFAAAAFSLPSAFANGAALATGYWSIVTGIACVAAVGIGVLLLPVVIECFNARDCWSGVLLMPVWLIAFSLTLASSIGNAATNRGDAVQSKAGQIEPYERASATLARLNVDLDTAKHAPQWETTAACTMVGRKTAACCDHIKELGQKTRDASAIVDAGRRNFHDISM
jgi:hypothetical protein